jgi:hypothetical protein
MDGKQLDNESFEPKNTERSENPAKALEKALLLHEHHDVEISPIRGFYSWIQLEWAKGTA